MIRLLIQLILIAWASPGSLVGLLIGGIGLLTGGSVQRTGCVLEFWGGFNSWFLSRVPLITGAAAITFGHVVLGIDKPTIEITRSHELIHVRQYERWGPFFLPAYAICSIVLWFRKKDPYYENPFEKEAYENAD